jgi:hypothetical protein
VTPKGKACKCERYNRRVYTAVQMSNNREREREREYIYILFLNIIFNYKKLIKISPLSLSLYYLPKIPHPKKKKKGL